MSKVDLPHRPLNLSAPYSSDARLTQTTNQPSTATKLDTAHLLTDDPAVLIGLALAFVRQQPGGDGAVPTPILVRLAAHAGAGDPACCLVLDWLDGRHAAALVSDPETDRPEQSSRSRTFSARKTIGDDVMERLSGRPPRALQPPGRKRQRWPFSIESKGDVGPETVSANEETSHG